MRENEIAIDAFQLLPKSPTDIARWNESRRRRRMLEGLWEQDVKDRIAEYFSKVRELVMGKPATGLNLFNSVINQHAIVYDNEFTIQAPEGVNDAAKVAFSEVLSNAHLAQLLQRNCKLVTGLREGLMKLIYTNTGLRYNVVPADIVVVKHAPQDPSTLTEVREGIILSSGAPAWDVWNIENPEAPFHIIEDLDGKDISAEVLKEPGVYKERKTDGTPFLPYVMYHAEWSDKLWNAWDYIELADASLDLAVLWTMFGDGIRKAAWPQRYIINLRLDGATVTKGPDARAGYVDTAPTSIIVLKPIDPNAPASAGQFQPGCDPTALGEAIVKYMTVVLSNIGINPADMQSTPQAQSGYAIQLKRSAQRREAKKAIPNFRDGDTELLDKTAMMLNIYEGAKYPEEGWGINYNLPELANSEIKEAVEAKMALIELGMASKVDMFIELNPEWATRPRAAVVEHLTLLARENTLF